MARGLIIAAPRSGSGKTVLTFGLLAALRARGLRVSAAKTGPDYLDGALLGRAAGREAINLDPWAMRPERLRALAGAAAEDADLLVVEGVMGLFDGAADGRGSTGDLAEVLGLPVVLVVDSERQSQSVAPLVSGFAQWRAGVRIAGVILNRVGSARHETMLRAALAETGISCLGAIPREAGLSLPERHLGLVLPGEVAGFLQFTEAAGRVAERHVDLEAVLAMAGEIAPPRAAAETLPPLGQRTAIARDAAFAFLYPHLMNGWRAAGAELSFFSPLADEAPADDADAVFLPGGYPELHGERLAHAERFKAGLRAARDRGALIYGECGGFMALGETLTDKAGQTHRMASLLPVRTRIDRPRRVLGYRQLRHTGALPWPAALKGHEFHYSAAEIGGGLPPLFEATDALGEAQAPMGGVLGRVMGSYAHVIEAA